MTRKHDIYSFDNGTFAFVGLGISSDIFQTRECGSFTHLAGSVHFLVEECGQLLSVICEEDIGECFCYCAYPQ